MAVFEESGLRLTVPDGHWFRFADMAAYRALSGRHLSEMDVGWWDHSAAGTLWVVEIKDYSGLPATEQLPTHLLERLTSKATDVLLLLSAAWLNTNRGQQLRVALPVACRSVPLAPKRLRLVFVLRVHAPMGPDLQRSFGVLKSALAARMSGRAALFDLEDVSLCDHVTAAKYLPLVAV